jgi:hypothetical protein
MSTLACRCGAAISNTTYPSPTEGTLTSQHDEEPTGELCATKVTEYTQALAAGEDRQWCVAFFSGDYPADAKPNEVISDIISDTYSPKQRAVCECSSCGRLWVQTTPGENIYLSFSPDEPGYHAVLASKDRQQP